MIERLSPELGKQVSLDVSEFESGAIPSKYRKALKDILVQLARASGRWSAAEIDTWSEARIAKLIYMPGLSTAEEVTRLSGRGVGMDIIKQSIHDLGGKIRTSFAPGRFTEFRIQLPVNP